MKSSPAFIFLLSHFSFPSQSPIASFLYLKSAPSSVLYSWPSTNPTQSIPTLTLSICPLFSLLFLSSQVLPRAHVHHKYTIPNLNCLFNIAQQSFNSLHFGHLEFLIKTLLDSEHQSPSLCACIPIILHIHFF